MGARGEEVFFLFMYTCNFFRSELPRREVQIKSSSLMCYKKRVREDSLVSCLCRDSAGDGGLAVPL